MGAVSNNQSYMIVLKKNGLRNDLINFLFKKKIETRKAITAIHKEKVFKNKFKKLKLKNSEFIAKNGIQLPIHANLSKKDCKNIIYFIEKYFHLKGFNEQV